MKALTVRQPRPYIDGVLHGDGWLTGLTLGLRVADGDFAVAFCAAIKAGYARHLVPQIDERGYHLVRTTGRLVDFAGARETACDSDEARAAWLRGLFDSEGNAQLCSKPRQGSRSWSRRVSWYSTAPATLDRAASYLDALDLPHVRRAVTLSAGHLGDRPVWELRLRAGRDAYARFAELVGSSIARKQTVLDALPASYVDDLPGARRDAQARGAASRRAATDAHLDEVLTAIRAAIADDARPTQRHLAPLVPGFWSQHRRHGTRRLVEMACAA